MPKMVQQPARALEEVGDKRSYPESFEARTGFGTGPVS